MSPANVDVRIVEGAGHFLQLEQSDAVARTRAGMDLMTKPVLPDGLVAVVKRECATCVMTEPVLATIARSETLTVFTQDDETFPASVPHSFDSDLSVSWHHDIETVPTLIRVENGVEVDRTIGWSRDAWRALTGHRRPR